MVRGPCGRRRRRRRCRRRASRRQPHSPQPSSAGVDHEQTAAERGPAGEAGGGQPAKGRGPACHHPSSRRRGAFRTGGDRRTGGRPPVASTARIVGELGGEGVDLEVAEPIELRHPVHPLVGPRVEGAVRGGGLSWREDVIFLFCFLSGPERNHREEGGLLSGKEGTRSARFRSRAAWPTPGWQTGAGVGGRDADVKGGAVRHGDALMAAAFCVESGGPGRSGLRGVEVEDIGVSGLEEDGSSSGRPIPTLCPPTRDGESRASILVWRSHCRRAAPRIGQRARSGGRRRRGGMPPRARVVDRASRHPRSTWWGSTGGDDRTNSSQPSRRNLNADVVLDPVVPGARVVGVSTRLTEAVAGDQPAQASDGPATSPTRVLRPIDNACGASSTSRCVVRRWDEASPLRVPAFWCGPSKDEAAATRGWGEGGENTRCHLVRTRRSGGGGGGGVDHDGDVHPSPWAWDAGQRQGAARLHGTGLMDRGPPASVDTAGRW